MMVARICLVAGMVLLALPGLTLGADQDQSLVLSNQWIWLRIALLDGAIEEIVNLPL